MYVIQLSKDVIYSSNKHLPFNYYYYDCYTLYRYTMCIQAGNRSTVCLP